MYAVWIIFPFSFLWVNTAPTINWPVSHFIENRRVKSWLCNNGAENNCLFKFSKESLVSFDHPKFFFFFNLSVKELDKHYEGNVGTHCKRLRTFIADIQISAKYIHEHPELCQDLFEWCHGLYVLDILPIIAQLTFFKINSYIGFSCT